MRARGYAENTRSYGPLMHVRAKSSGMALSNAASAAFGKTSSVDEASADGEAAVRPGEASGNIGRWAGAEAGSAA